MNCRTVEWILWAIAMTVFLGLAIAVVAVLWYVIVPAFSSGRQ